MRDSKRALQAMQKEKSLELTCIFCSTPTRVRRKAVQALQTCIHDAYMCLLTGATQRERERGVSRAYLYLLLLLHADTS